MGETFIGNDRTVKPKGDEKGRSYAHKHKVLPLVERNSGLTRMMVVDDLEAGTIRGIACGNLAKEATLMTDQAAY